MLSGIGTTEILIIAGLIFLFFGGRKIKELARGLGESKKEVKKLKKELVEKGESEEDM